MSSVNSSEAAAPGQREELAPPSQEGRRRSIQPGIIRQSSMHSMNNHNNNIIAKSTMHIAIKYFYA